MDIDKYIRITCQNGQVLTANARDVCSCITKDKSKTCKNYACAHGKDCGIFRRTTCVPFHTRYRNKMEKDRAHVLSHHCADLMSMDNLDVKISSKQRQLRRKRKLLVL